MERRAEMCVFQSTENVVPLVHIAVENLSVRDLEKLQMADHHRNHHLHLGDLHLGRSLDHAGRIHSTDVKSNL